MRNKKYTPETFSSMDPKDLKFTGPCKKQNHIGPDGQGIRSKLIHECLACKCKLPPGIFDFQFDATFVQPARVCQTPEEAKARHIQQVINWQKRNPQKVRGYVDTYTSKPETKAKYKAKNAENYRANKEEICRLARENYSKKANESRETRTTDAENE